MKQKHIAIISAEREHLSRQINEERTRELHRWIQRMKLPHKKVEGYYNGQAEVSFVIELRTQREKDYIKFIASFYGQECTLYSTSNRDCYLQHATGEIEWLKGKLRAIPETLVAQLNNYTYDPTTGYYYTVY